MDDGIDPVDATDDSLVVVDSIEDFDVDVDVLDELVVVDSEDDGRTITAGRLPVGAASGELVGGAENASLVLVGVEGADEGDMTVDGANTIGAEVLAVVVVSCPTMVVSWTTIVVTVSSLELELVLTVGCITVERLDCKLVVPTDPSFAAAASFCPVIDSKRSDNCRRNGKDLDFNISCASVSFIGSCEVDESLELGRLICRGK